MPDTLTDDCAAGANPGKQDVHFISRRFLTFLLFDLACFRTCSHLRDV